MLTRVVYKSSSVEDTKKIALFFAKKFIKHHNKVIIFLSGEMGSGKTTFTRYVLNGLGIDDREFEGSPTFTIINEYKNNIFHIDLYRLKTKEDLENIGLFELLDKKGIFLIEWPKLLELEKGIFVQFEITDGSIRKIFIDKR